MADQQPDFEQTVATLNNAYAYKIPPTLNIDNFTCETWPKEWMVFTGTMRVITTQRECYIILLNPDGTEATRFPVQYRGAIPVLNQASDSSRFFVLVISDPSGARQAFVGIGFKDRETAFDFKVALTDFGKWLDRLNNPQPVQQVTADFALKDGEKIKISLGKKKTQAAEPPKPVTSFGPPPM